MTTEVYIDMKDNKITNVEVSTVIRENGVVINNKHRNVIFSVNNIWNEGVKKRNDGQNNTN
tara:strand:+ start:1134 stop:1316 length:183 start_codon:yes stop_codon:yes gene_type:complete